MKNLVPRALCAAVLVVGLAGGPAVADAHVGTVSASSPSVAGFVTPMEPVLHHLGTFFTVPTITCTPGENSQAFLGTVAYATDRLAVPFAGVRLACIDGSATYEGVLGSFQGRPIWPVLPGDKMRAHVYPNVVLRLADMRTSDNAVSGWPVQGNWETGSAGAYRGAGPITDFTSAHFGRLFIDNLRATRETTQRSRIRQHGVVLVGTSRLSKKSGFTVSWKHG